MPIALTKYFVGKLDLAILTINHQPMQFGLFGIGKGVFSIKLLWLIPGAWVLVRLGFRVRCRLDFYLL